MFAYKFGRDESCASNHFMLSTAASIAAIPLIMMVSGFPMHLFMPQIVQNV